MFTLNLPALLALLFGRSSDARTPAENTPSNWRYNGLARLILAALTLLVVAFDPLRGGPRPGAAFLAPLLYLLYSAVLFALPRRAVRPDWLARNTFWLDAAWFLLFALLDPWDGGVFFCGLVFAVLLAVLQRAASTAIAIASSAALGLAAIYLLTGGQDAPGVTGEFWLLPPGLLLGGAIIVLLVSGAAAARRRLDLLNRITVQPNPRFGISRVVERLLTQLRQYYGSSAALLVYLDSTEQASTLYRSFDGVRQQGAEELPAQLATRLILAPHLDAVLYNGNAAPFWLPGVAQGCFAISGGQRQRLDGDAEACATVAGIIGIDSFISVPLRVDGGAQFRLYVAAEGRNFSAGDVQFIAQVAERVAPIIQTIRLVDRLVSSAVEDERQRIARDLHDSTIQPYLGLRMGLAALQRVLPPDNGALEGAVDQLMRLTDDGVEDLRSYVKQLRRTDTTGSGLARSVERFAQRLTQATGLQIALIIDRDLQLPDRLAGELFQMIVEGLSNIRRHTHSELAVVRLGETDGLLRLSFRNSGVPANVGFIPRSLVERAAALGGQARVTYPDSAHTEVRIEIPL